MLRPISRTSSLTLGTWALVVGLSLPMTFPLMGFSEAQAKSTSPGKHAFVLETPNLIADVAEAVAPSVVNIDIEKKEQITVPDISALPFQNPMFNEFFGFGHNSPFQRFPSNRTQSRITVGNGSGVILDTQGHILTNNHVVRSADRIIVTLKDGRKLPAKVIGRDAFTDLAVVKVDGATQLKPAKFGSSTPLRPGEWALAIGNPMGFDHTVTLGIISATSRRIPDLNSNVEFIQTDAAINPGNSGGPLVNLQGEVIGINTAIFGRAQNMGFSIPVNVVKNVAQSLIQHGKIIRPWVGISMTTLSPELAKGLGISENTQGVVIAQVMPDSPADRGGFRQGDVIQRIDGQPIHDAKTVQELVQSKPLQSTLNFQIIREGALMALPLTTDQLSEQWMEQRAQPRVRQFRFQIP